MVSYSSQLLRLVVGQIRPPLFQYHLLRTQHDLLHLPVPRVPQIPHAFAQIQRSHWHAVNSGARGRTPDLTRDMFSHSPLWSPLRFRFALGWWPSLDGRFTHRQFIIHGIFEKIPRGVIFVPIRESEVKLERVLCRYKHLIMKYWPHPKNPHDFEAAKYIIKRSWRKHGSVIGMTMEMYLFYGLALRHALPNSLGLDVGRSMTLMDASNTLRDIANNFWLFGNYAGAFVRPEIVSRMSPFDPMHPFWIEEIRFMLERRMSHDGIARWRMIQQPGNTYAGAAQFPEQLVILPPTL
ncbi:hypothetical protein OROGR_021107 [Orobanche gracilis]